MISKLSRTNPVGRGEGDAGARSLLIRATKSMHGLSFASLEPACQATKHHTPPGWHAGLDGQSQT
eukprot:5220529-Karenia_brevis.AAC.1